ncbi:MAG: radical SAM family heme chaperone HemW [Actinomycetes bacterium]
MPGALSPLSFYIHVPYCLKRCGYCDFNTYTPGELRNGGDLATVSDGYIDLLIKECNFVPPAGPIPTIFFGGGTPTLMEPSDLGRLLRHLENRFGFTEDAEITIEANPDTVTAEKLQQLKEIGINRISFGMQSSNPQVLKVLDRTHNPENVFKATEWAKSANFEHISVDLIYGVPSESIADWRSSVETALSLPIDHISAYALIVEDGTKLAGQVRRAEVVMPDEDETADKYLLVDELATAAGLSWYELSNWSKPGGECRHNIAYWEGKNWWGLGPGAHSHMNGRRWWNVKHPNAYREKLSAQNSPMHDEEELTVEQIEQERIMLNIRLPRGLPLATLSAEQVQNLLPYRESGHLDAGSWGSGNLTLTRSGRLIADRIVREILL